MVIEKLLLRTSVYKSTPGPAKSVNELRHLFLRLSLHVPNLMRISINNDRILALP